ncbi:MAG: hypothetical protein RL514_3327 [Verrucomicrobiota bacterium]|jgi:signal transduction histidine kinase
MSQKLPAKGRLRLPADGEALRKLRHDLRTPINPILGFCELIVDEAGDAAPAPFLAGVQALHGVGQRMLKLTNEVFGEAPSPLRQLGYRELLRTFRAPAGEATALCTRLEQAAAAAALPVAAEDLRRIGGATGEWLARVEASLEQHCR